MVHNVMAHVTIKKISEGSPPSARFGELLLKTPWPSANDEIR